jgi:nucleoside-diphosphate-sugar epimerase
MIYNLNNLYNEKTVLVTGGSGYIGSALINKLKKINCQIIRTSRNKIVSIDGVEDKITDLTTKENWIEILRNADVVFHLAGNTSIAHAEENVDDSLMSNLLPINSLINAAKELKTYPRVVYASTATVYGIVDIQPVAEDCLPKPESIYDLHKLYAEQYLAMANNQGILSAKSLRLSNVYGPSLSESLSEDRGILSRITKSCMQGHTINAYGGGNYLRDYIYIDDVVDAFLCSGIADSPHIVLNVASGIGTTVREVFEMIANEVEKNIGISSIIQDSNWPDNTNIIETRNFIASNERLKSLLDWKVNVPLGTGIKRLVKHYS